MRPSYQNLLCVFLAVVSASFVTSRQTRASEPSKPPGTIVSAEMAVNGEPIRIPVEIDGRLLSFIVDTGSRVSLIATAQARSLESQKHKTTSAELGTLEVISVDEIKVCGKEFDGAHQFVKFDLSDFTEGLGVPIDGVLGRTFLSQFVMHLDFDSGKLFLCQPSAHYVVPGQQIPLTNDSRGHPCVHVSLNGGDPQPFLIDTGSIAGIKADGSVLAKGSNGLHPTGLFVRSASIVGAGEPQQLLRCSTLTLGNYRHQNLIVEPSTRSKLGLYFLSRYRLTIDFQRATSYWNPCTRFSLSDREDACGFVDRMMQAGTREVTLVQSGSIADRSGLRSGDRIVSVNGVSVGNISPPQWMRLFMFPTFADQTLMIERDGGKRVVVIPGG